MKALSIRQPWAWAILHAGKRIENRDWRGCSYRGPLLIHASKGCGIEEYADAAMWMHEQHLATPIEWRLDRQHPDTPKLQALSTLPRGGIVGVCNLVATVDPSGAVRLADGTLGAPPSDARDFLAWHAGGFGLVLADVRPLPFMAYKGALGFFDVPGADPEMVVEVARREGRLLP